MEEKKAKSNRFYIYQGLAWGLCMFIFMEILEPLIDKEPYEFDMMPVLIKFVVWMIIGLGFGFFNKRFAPKD